MVARRFGGSLQQAARDDVSRDTNQTARLAAIARVTLLRQSVTGRRYHGEQGANHCGREKDNRNDALVGVGEQQQKMNQLNMNDCNGLPQVKLHPTFFVPHPLTGEY